MIQNIRVVWPAGSIDPLIHCPSCGSVVLSPLNDQGPTCHHVQFLIDSESKDFNYITPEFEDIIEVYRSESVEPELREWVAVESFLEEAQADTFIAFEFALENLAHFHDHDHDHGHDHDHDHDDSDEEDEDDESEEREIDYIYLRVGFELFFDADQNELFEELERQHEQNGH